MTVSISNFDRNDERSRHEVIEAIRQLEGAELVSAVVDLIEAVQDRWDQNSWRFNGKEQERYEAWQQDVLNPGCHTSFCAAGWIGALDGVKWYRETVEGIGRPGVCNCSSPECVMPSHYMLVSTYAAGRLGLTEDEAQVLFDGSNTLEDLRTLADAMENGISLWSVVSELDRGGENEYATDDSEDDEDYDDEDEEEEDEDGDD